MPSWSTLLKSQHPSPPPDLDRELLAVLSQIAKLREKELAQKRHVVFYASGVLQKRDDEAAISREDVNGLMNALYDVKEDHLTLILHTPGGDLAAVESIVEYLHSKYKHIEVIVPALAMSGGAMISLASDHLIISKAGQLGPFDPQMLRGGKQHSARVVQEGFAMAREEIRKDIKMAHVWAPILQSMDTFLFMEAEKVLSYSKELVSNWLMKRDLLKDPPKGKAKADKVKKITAYFNAEKNSGYGQIHLHEQRIGLEKLREMNLKVTALEDSQVLQEQVLTAYHLMTIIFEQRPALKFIASNKNGMWVKNQPPVVIPLPQQ